MVLTFDPHPLAILRPKSAPTPLTWIERRAALLKEYGVDEVVVCRTDAALLHLTAREFFDEVLRERLAASALVEGPNFHFGRGRQGDVETLSGFCRDADVPLEIVAASREGDDLVSSSRIRELISAGNVVEAADLLGRPHRIRGRVTRGAGRGAGLGFPTANLAAVDVVTPAPGVYAGAVQIGEVPYTAAVHVGPSPTFGAADAAVEVHVVGYDGDLYNGALEVDLLDRIRATQAFSSPEALRAQIAEDLATIREVAMKHAVASASAAGDAAKPT